MGPRWRPQEPSKTLVEKLFPRNEHTLDRALRVLLGVGLLATVFAGPKTPFGYLGLVPLVTGLLGSCPLYTLFGVGTCKITPTHTPKPR